MIRNVLLFSLRFPIIILGLAVVVLVVGSVTLANAKWDVFPEFAPPQIVVQTEAPGFSADEVEQLVAMPVESAISGVPRLKLLRSSSVPGLCVVTAIFEDGTHILEARQLVSERLLEVRSLLPDTAETPRLMPLTASTSRLLMIGLTAKDPRSPHSLRTLADWTLRRRLQAVPGVAHVEVFGGETKQYQILVSPQKLQENAVSLDDVLTASRHATGFGGAGFIETTNQRIPIRQRTRLERPADLAAAPIALRDGISLKLSHVTDVQVGGADRVGSACINGAPGVLLVIHKQPEFNTLTVTHAVQDALKDLRPTLPPEIEISPALFRQASFIERAISNLGWSLILGCILVTAVLILFLFNWRVLIISLTAIPLSLMGAIIVLLGFGVSLNAMTLGGLAIALGEVVDDAIVDVENVLRRLQNNRSSATPKSAFQVVLDASLEVRSAVVFASFIVILVFVPIFFLQGLAGKLFSPLGLAYIVAILVSLAVALTVTPAMCLLMLTKTSIDIRKETRLVRLSNWMYSRTLPAFLHRPKTVCYAAILSFAVAMLLIPFFGGEFLPDFRESNFVIFMAGKPDSSIVESERSGMRLADEILKIPGVRSVAQQIGRADLSEDTWSPNISEVWISLHDDANYDEVIAKVRSVLDQTPGYAFQVKQFLRERIDEVISGSTADMAIRLVGPDLAVLRREAQRVADLISHIKGIKDLRVEQLVDTPQLDVLLKPENVSSLGFSVGGVNQQLQALLRGVVVGQVFEDDSVFDVVVRGNKNLREDPRQLRELLLEAPNGDAVPLREIADVSLINAPNMVNREQSRRRLLVTCNAEGRDTQSTMTEIQAVLQQSLKLPSGYHVEYAGEFQAKADAQRRLLLYGLISLFGIFLLLYLDFKSVQLSVMVMLSVPLACIGGVISVWMAGGDLSLGSLVGFVTVFGIAIRNGILLISNYQHAMVNGRGFDAGLVIDCSVERLAPILMTAATTALAVIPLIIFGEMPGQEIEHPMAVVIVGGLISSTILTLFVLPTLFLRFGSHACATDLHPSALPLAEQTLTTGPGVD